MAKGNILGYLISEEGIFIDPKRTESITEIAYPNNKKSMQSFLGNIDLAHRFISGFAKIIKPLQGIIKKDVLFKWNDESEEAFTGIKQAIV